MSSSFEQENQYDIIFVGDSLANLYAATKIISTERRVLIIDDQKKFEWDNLVDSFVYDHNVPCYLGVKDLLNSFLPADKGEGDLPVFNNNDFYYYLKASHRVKFSFSKEKLLKEFALDSSSRKRVLIQGLLEFCELEKENIKESWEVLRKNRNKNTYRLWKQRLKFFENKFHELQNLDEDILYSMIEAGIAANTQASPSYLSAEHFFRYLLYYAAKDIYKEPEKGFIKKALLKELEESRFVKILKDTQVESLVTDKGLVRGVLVDSAEGVIWGSKIILGNRAPLIYKTLPKEMTDDLTLSEIEKQKRKHWKFTVNVKIPKENTPYGFDQDVLIVKEAHLPLEEENMITIRKLPEGFVDGLDSETNTFIISVLIPNAASKKNYNYLRKLTGRLLQSIEESYPFFVNSIKKITPDPRKPHEFEKIYPQELLFSSTDELVHYYLQGTKQTQAIQNGDIVTNHQNLFFSGKYLWPGLGVSGEIMTGLFLSEVLKN